MQQYAVPNMQEYAEISQKKYAIYVHNKLKYAKIC